MSSSTSKIGHTLAKGLGIKIPYRDPLGSEADPVTRGESVFTSGTAETYIEPEPTVVGWIQEQIPNTHDVFNYFVNLFPFLKWITRYNMQWFIGDLVAGMFFPLLFIFTILTGLPFRYHCRRRCRSSRNVLRSVGCFACRIRSLFLIHGCFDLLVLCHF
jgi:hypothetical protein